MEQECVATGQPAAEWLPPGAALAHFEPIEGTQLMPKGEERAEVRARYGFRIGELGLLVSPDAGSEVLAVPAACALPGASPGFLGLINLRGSLVPLYDLCALLGMGESGAATMVLVFGQGEQAVAVLTDGYPKALLSLRPLSSLPPLPAALGSHVSGGYVQDDAVWLEFDHVSYFDEVCGVGLPQVN